MSSAANVLLRSGGLCRYDALRTGEAAEVIVLSKSRAFESFKVRRRNLRSARTVPEPHLAVCMHAVLWGNVPEGNLPALLGKNNFIGPAAHCLFSMQALKEVYLPECGVWVSDYPFLNREAYLECSLEIERERQQEEAHGFR